MSTEPAAVPHIAPHTLAACYADAVRCYPDEACGLLIGPRAPGDGPCDEVRVCDNAQNRLHALDPETFPRTARTAYQLPPKDVLYLQRSLDGERPVRVIYHSHVDVGAYFSAEDEHAATFEGELIYPVDYLVIDCGPEGVRGAKLFRFADGRFTALTDYPAAGAR